MPGFLVAVTFDPSINFGSLVIAATTLLSISAAWWALRGSVDKIGGRVDQLHDLLKRHEGEVAKRIDEHAHKLDQLQDIASNQAGMLQRLIGQLEATRRLDFNPSNERRSRDRA